VIDREAPGSGGKSARIAGWLLLAGSAFLVAAAVLFGAGADSSADMGRWQGAALDVGLVLTLFGLIAFDEVLRDRGERLLPRIAVAAFAIGVTCFIVADAIAQGGGRFVFELERAYVVLGCVAIAAFGWAIVRTGVVSIRLGWAAILWAAAWAVLYLTRIVEAPLGPNVITAAFGVALARRA